MPPCSRWLTALSRVGVRVDLERWNAALAWCLMNLDPVRVANLRVYGPEIARLAASSPDGRVRVHKWKRRASGRWYALGPELQTITRYMRCGVVPAPGFAFADVDLRACHLYIAAYLAQDEVLLGDLGSGDLHQSTGSRVAPHHEASVARRLGKVLNFTVLNGGGRTAIVQAAAADGVTLTREEAGFLRERWFARYGAVARWVGALNADEVYVDDGQDMAGGLTRRWIQRDGRVDRTRAHAQRQRTALALQSRESALLAHMLRALVETAMVTSGWNPDDPLTWPVRACVAMHDGFLLEVQRGYETMIERWLREQVVRVCATVGLPPIPLDVDFRPSWANRRHDPWAR